MAYILGFYTELSHKEIIEEIQKNKKLYDLVVENVLKVGRYIKIYDSIKEHAEEMYSRKINLRLEFVHDSVEIHKYIAHINFL